LLMLDSTPAQDIDLVRSFLPDDQFDVSTHDSSITGNLEGLLANEEIIVARVQPVTLETIQASPNLKLVQKYGGRADRLDLDAARNAGVALALMPLSGCIAVAELAMALILALS